MSSKEFNKLTKQLKREVGRAVGDYGMIKEGDKIMAFLSGGPVWLNWYSVYWFKGMSSRITLAASFMLLPICSD